MKTQTKKKELGIKKKLDLHVLEQTLFDLVQLIYEEGEVRFTPRYPWVLVRVLPKTQAMLGRIILPQTQNKVIYEGFVLATWKPFYIVKKVEATRLRLAPEVVAPEEHILRESQLRVGQRIGFPHYEGMPIRHFDEEKYRLVREEVDLKDNPNCGVLGWVEYDGDRKLKDELDRLLEGASMVTVSGE